jgi:ubiquinol-cytochrome c reductase cytochrome b subunit
MSSTAGRATATVGNSIDERFASSNIVKRSARKIFPDHWSFMLGEIALYSFIILLLTGVYLTFFFKPSATEVIYDGSYVPLRGVHMSEAFASTLHISFDVRGGMIMRSIHHWAALIFVASITVHLLRVFFTGAFRKPRELNWLIGIGLLTLAIAEGFAGYSLPDDLLSGTGVRITSGIIQAIPVVGTYLAFMVFGGEFPGTDFIPRLYTVHVLLVPGILLALITAHLMMVWFQKHTQYPGAGRREDNVVGYPFMPVYIAKAGGFFFIVFGITALISAFVVINPVWLYGAYNPGQVTAGSQPDWYIGFLEGALRLMPGLETTLFGYTISWSVLLPAVVLPGIMFTSMALYPFIEAWVTGDKREHHLLDRPRNQPVRTGLGAMALTFYLVLFLAGGNDIMAFVFGLSINAITWTLRVALIVAPALAFVITKRICLGLQRRDRDKVLHGRETGIVMRTPTGEVYEVHEPIPAEERYLLTQHNVGVPMELPPATDENGVPRPGRHLDKVRQRLSRFYFSDSVPTATPAELEHAHGNGHGGPQAGGGSHAVERGEDGRREREGAGASAAELEGSEGGSTPVHRNP